MTFQTTTFGPSSRSSSKDNRAADRCFIRLSLVIPDFKVSQNTMWQAYTVVETLLLKLVHYFNAGDESYVDLLSVVLL